jgi:acyl-coenzyme A thioesterase 13
MRDALAPSGFEPIAGLRTSPFLDHVGPLFFRRTGPAVVLGLRVGPAHTNARGLAHGGLLLTMADVALGYQLAFSEEPPARLLTVSMSADFTGAARLGDWVEAHVDSQRLGARMAFANAYLTVRGERIARVSAVFSRASAERE